MDEKRCEWCGTLSPAEAEKCTLCRIPFGAPVPPPQDWSHLTGNIPVITAPLLETPAAAPASPPAASAEPGTVAATPVIPQQVQREPVVPEPVPARRAVPSVTAQESQAPVAAGFAPVAVPASEDVVPSVGEMVVEVARAAPKPGDTEIPGWRAPDDPTLRLFADRLEERDRRRSSASAGRRGRRRRLDLARLLVWLVAIGLIAAFVILAPARLPNF